MTYVCDIQVNLIPLSFCIDCVNDFGLNNFLNLDTVLDLCY
jgi:hypothetical protein